jgi:hypothetical protein
MHPAGWAPAPNNHHKEFSTHLWQVLMLHAGGCMILQPAKVTSFTDSNNRQAGPPTYLDQSEASALHLVPWP